jgi:integrase/recombinase XerD
MTISEAFAEFRVLYLLNEDRSKKTQTEYHGVMFGKNGIIAIIGDIPISMLGIDHVVMWKVHMRDEGIQAKSINTRLSCIRTFLRWLDENEYQVINWQKLKFDAEEKNKPKTVLSPEEVKKLVDCADTPRNKALIELFFGTGMRSEELISIDRDEWEAAEIVNHKEITEAGAIPIWELYVMGKNKKHRPICFFQGAKDAVDAYLDTRVDRFKPLFISAQNRRPHPDTVGKMLHKVSAKAGLTKVVTQHVFRHSYTTDKSANGMPTSILSYNLGHSNEAITQRIYIHLNQLHVRKAFGKTSTTLVK